MIKLNNTILSFVENLKKQENIQGIVLFGSWARGNQRATSDVDLLVIVKDGYKRYVEYLDNQAFEITYTNIQKAKQYYRDNPDITYIFWREAIILFDKENNIKELKQFATSIINKGKTPLSENDLKHLEFDARDQIRFAEEAYQAGNGHLANLILNRKITALTELYFDTIGKWRPATKQFFDEIKYTNSELYSQFIVFYSDNISFNEKISVSLNIIAIIFRKNKKD